MIVHDGTAQNHRHPAPLQPGYFNVAEMDLKTLLALGVDYASLINYYNFSNTIEGNWTRIFSGDDSMVLAHIIATNMSRIESNFQVDCNQPAHLLPSAAVAQASWSYRLAKKLDDWYVWLASATSKPGIDVRQVIARVIRGQLRDPLHGLTSLLGQYPAPILEPFNIEVDTFAPIWAADASTSTQRSSADGTPAADGDPSGIDALLQTCFHAFHNAVTLVIETAAARFSQVLARRDHEPAVALYIAFAKLFRQAQQHINRFAPQRLEYYYGDILQIRPVGPTPDTTFLVLALDGSLPEVMIPEKTAFTAGKDDSGKDLIYRADNDLWVTDTAVNHLHTIYFEKNPLMSPEKELDHVTGTWVATLTPPGDNHSSGSQATEPRPLFGASTGQAEEESASPAQLGLAIADPILLLGQGQRRITLGITFDASPADHPAAIVARISALTVPKTTATDAFYKIFKQIFRISLTADTGWYDVGSYYPDDAVIKPGPAQNCILLQIDLPPEAPPIVSYDPQLHGGAYQHAFPMMHLLINDQCGLYPYSLLRALTLKEIRIDVAVDGCKDLLAYNHHGQLDPSGPFHPFGPLPDMGSYLMVGSYEAARKRLTSLEVGLQWDTLPGGRQGMQHHYRLYDQLYRPDLFEVHATLLSNGRWNPVKQSEQPVVKLFQTPKDDDDPYMDISSRSVLKVHNLSLNTPLPKTIGKHQFAFNLGASGGFFKFTLANPPYGFGHKAYPLLLSRALTAKVKKKMPRPVPNPPFTPMVKSLAINYRARSVINMEKGLGIAGIGADQQIYHLHPLGWERIYPPADNRLQSVLPDHDHDGNLLIGLGGSKPEGILTLFFHIRPKSAQHPAGRNPKATWYYLSSNRWIELNPMQVVSDTTAAFTFSGIVTLDIPAEINRGNTILPDDCFWLRVAIDQDPQTAGHLFGAATQALKVTWENRGNTGDHLHAPLPAGSISQAQTAIAGIAKIMQPVASTNGRAAEAGRRLTTRVSERLRHKNRAITPWDYERLVLERFPEIFKVKCFAGTSTAKGRHTAGRVLIVVIPQLEAGRTDPDQRPMADTRLLGRIKKHLAQMALTVCMHRGVQSGV